MRPTRALREAVAAAAAATASAALHPTAPAVGVAAAIFPRLPCGRVDVTKMLLIQRGSPPGDGLFVFAGGRQELGETLAAAAVREAREETGLAVTPADAQCPGYAATDVLVPALPPHSFHYAIVHVLTSVDVPAADAGGRRGAALLPRVTAGDDAADALWVDLTALLRGGAGGGARGGAEEGGSADGASQRCEAGAAAQHDGPPRVDPPPPCLLALEAQGRLVPLTVEVARRAVRQWGLLGVPTTLEGRLINPPPAGARL